MSRLKTPFRYDYVGSFLRSEELISMRKDFEDGKITAEELKAAEDRCIADLVTKPLYHLKKLCYNGIEFL